MCKITDAQDAFETRVFSIRFKDERVVRRSRVAQQGQFQRFKVALMVFFSFFGGRCVSLVAFCRSSTAACTSACKCKTCAMWQLA